MSKYFPKPKTFGESVKTEVGLSKYATKADLRDATDIGTSNFAKNFDLTCLILEIAN